MKGLQLNRRAFLQAGGIALALPWLEAMFSPKALAAGTSDPKRYVCLYISSGSYLKTNDGAFWYPGSTSAPLNASALPDVFSPFAANAGDFSLVRGLKNQARFDCRGTGGDHSTAIATYLTATPYTNGSLNQCTLNGSSLDQAMAAANGLKAYALSASGNDSYHADSTPFDYSRTVSYLNGRQADTWLNPYALFQSLFGGISVPDAGTPAPPSPFVRNKSILDSAVASIRKLQSGLGAADKQRVEDYYTHLRSVEATLVAGSSPGSVACDPSHPPSTSLNNEDHQGTGLDFTARLKAFMDIMTLAFQCNNAQMFTLLFEYENTNRQFRNQIPSSLVYQGANMNTSGSHNEIAHWADGGASEVTERRNRCVSRDRFYVSQMMYLVNALKAARDPSGASILDNTIIQLGHGLEDGNHNTDGMNATTGHPVVLAGGRNILSPGNFYALPNNDLKDLYYTLNKKLGMGLSSFGGSTTLLPI